jgi:protein-S-isoprenylcysteine O-methyltransferase Ste14
MSDRMPKAVRGYRLFCGFSVVANFGLAWLCAVSPEFGPERFPDVPGFTWSMMAGIMAPFGIVLAVFNFVLLWMPRTPWAYAVHLSNLGLTACGCVFAPICGPMAIAFLKPDVKRYFGVPIE